MSDRDIAPEPPDPVDQAVLQAEAILDDDAARAARRALVLAAVAREATAAPAVPGPLRQRRPILRRGGWLVAAGVAGLSVLVASQVYRTMPQPAHIEPATPMTAAAPSRPATSPPPPAEAAPSAPALEAPPAPAPRTPALEPPRHDEVTAAPMNVPAPPAPDIAPAQVSPPPPPAAAPAFEAPQTVVVTAERRASAPREDDGSNQPAGDQALAAAPPIDRDERLRAAAAAGRTSELEALLDQGAPVDAPDADGNTALMKSVEADHPEAAALLRRRGADPDRVNNAGESTRDVAAAKGDPALSRALGVAP